MKIQVANSEYPDKRLWLELPITHDPDFILTTGKLAGLASPEQSVLSLRITDVESPIPNLKRYILADACESKIERMNLLAQSISVMNAFDQLKFSSAMDIEAINGIEDIQQTADNIDDYELFPDVTTEKELGVYLVESGDVDIHASALPYLDYAMIGAEYYANHSCSYGNNCLVVKKDSTETNRAVIFELKLTSDYYMKKGAPPIRLTLPASPEKLNAVAERLRLPESRIDKCKIADFKSPIPCLQELLRNERQVTQLNNLAIEVEWLSRCDKNLFPKFQAVLEIEQPDTADRMQRIARELDDYELINAKTPADYGYHVLYKSDLEKRDIEFRAEVEPFIDFQKYGQWRMEQDGVRQTDFGMMHQISEPFEPQETMRMQMQ